MLAVLYAYITNMFGFSRDAVTLTITLQEEFGLSRCEMPSNQHFTNEKALREMQTLRAHRSPPIDAQSQ